MTDAERHAREADPPRYDPATDLGPTEPPVPAVEASAPWPGSQPTAAPLASVIAKPKSSSGRGTSLLLALAAAIAVGGIAFAAGRLTAPAATASAGRPGVGQLPSGQVPGNGQGFPGRGDAMGGVTLNGTVSAISADSVTLELESGSSITIPLDEETAYRTSTAGTAADVTVGSTVKVTPGARVADPNASPDPDAPPALASGAPGLGGLSFGAATEVTVVEP